MTKKNPVYGQVMSIQQLREWSDEAVQTGYKSPSRNLTDHLAWWSKSGRDKFFSGEKPEDAVKALRVGRKDLLKETDVGSLRVVRELVLGMIKQPAFSVVGSSVSVPRFLQSHPLPMRRLKEEPGGLQRVVLNISSLCQIDGEYRRKYALGALGIAQALSMRGPTELYLICPNKAFHYPATMDQEDDHIVLLIPFGLSPWDLSLLCGVMTSGAVRGLVYARKFELYKEATGNEMESSIPHAEMQTDDMMERVFDDWDSTRSVLIPSITSQQDDPVVHAIEAAVWGSALK